MKNKKNIFFYTEKILNENSIICKRFEACDGHDKLYDELWDEYMKKEYTDAEKKLNRKLLISRGALGYLLSMKKIFENALEQNLNYICIIDDDIMINKKFDIEYISKILVKLSNFNILKFGSSQWLFDDIKIKDNYYDSNKLSNGSFFNIYKKETYNLILDKIKNFDEPFDFSPLRQFINNKYYTLYPNEIIANLDHVSSISNKLRTNEYSKFKWNLNDYYFINNSAEIIYEKKNVVENYKFHFVIGITTFNRFNYFKSMFESLLNSLIKTNKYTIIISLGNLKNYDNTLSIYNIVKFVSNNINNIKNINCVIINNYLHYIYFNSNIILGYSKKLTFDFGFIINDDIFFIKKEWCEKYYFIAKQTNYFHLCYCVNNTHTLNISNLLKSNGNVHKSNGVLLTFTREIIENIGFFDEDNFKVRGQSHHDWSLRCCRMKYNNSEIFCDIIDSNDYIILNDKNYENSILHTKTFDKMLYFVDKFELERRNIIINDDTRIYINSIYNDFFI